MDINSLLNKFIGTNGRSNPNLGLAGGALAGGALALFMGNKGVKKLAGTAASVGGMALLGGLAVKAFQNWQKQSRDPAARSSPCPTPEAFLPSPGGKDQLEMSIIKAMVAAAKADGHLDNTEQEKIFKRVQEYDFTSEEKTLLFELLSRPVQLREVCSSVSSLEHKAEIYLASKIACGGDSILEQHYLAQLTEELHLPQELTKQLDQQLAEHSKTGTAGS